MSRSGSKFVVTPKADKTVTITIRIDSELNNHIEEISSKSGRSRNELINKALKYAFDNVEFSENN